MRAPYGMTPGVRAVLPGVNDMSATAWNKPPEPDKIDLDAPIANPPPPGPQGQPAGAEPMGWELTDPNGNVVHLRSDAHKQRDADQVKALGSALLNHAVSDQEKAIAQRAIDWGMAQVGQADIGEIRKEMTHYWDAGTGGLLKMDLQGMKSKANRGGKGGVPGPIGPDGAPVSKTQHAFDKDTNALVNAIIANERTNDKYAATMAAAGTLDEIEALLDSGNAMGQRVAVQQQLLALTGKASRESEQAAITGAAGKWNEFQNKLRLWTSDEPNLTRAYISTFKGMLAAQRAQLQKRRDQLAREAAGRVREQVGRQAPPDTATWAADLAYGSMSGNGAALPGGAYTPPARAAAPGSSPGDPYQGLD